MSNRIEKLCWWWRHMKHGILFKGLEVNSITIVTCPDICRLSRAKVCICTWHGSWIHVCRIQQLPKPQCHFKRLHGRCALPPNFFMKGMLPLFWLVVYCDCGQLGFPIRNSIFGCWCYEDILDNGVSLSLTDLIYLEELTALTLGFLCAELRVLNPSGHLTSKCCQILCSCHYSSLIW